mmetsp:Transcript_122180/g.228182  ORF Transcript_122180/g.228182 Transcript_122180/m.228182 type:complete len:203 (+) Transcript_122180:419-1027(+)
MQWLYSEQRCLPDCLLLEVRHARSPKTQGKALVCTRPRACRHRWRKLCNAPRPATSPRCCGVAPGDQGVSVGSNPDRTPQPQRRKILQRAAEQHLPDAPSWHLWLVPARLIDRGIAWILSSLQCDVRQRASAGAMACHSRLSMGRRGSHNCPPGLAGSAAAVQHSASSSQTHTNPAPRASRLPAARPAKMEASSRPQGVRAR